MRIAKKDREEGAEMHGKVAGIQWQWIPGNSLPPKQTRQDGTNTAAQAFEITESLFADDTTLIGYKGELEQGCRIIKRTMQKFEEKCHDG